MITLHYVKAFVVVIAVAGLSGCATDLYQNMPQAYFHQGPGELTLADVRSQDDAQSRCVAVANQTTPSTASAAWYYGSRYALGGLIGGGIGYTADTRIMGIAAVHGAALGAGAYYGIASGVIGAFAGPINNDIIKRNTDVWCRALDAYGIKMYPPSTAKKMHKKSVKQQSVETSVPHFHSVYTQKTPFPPAW